MSLMTSTVVDPGSWLQAPHRGCLRHAIALGRWLRVCLCDLGDLAGGQVVDAADDLELALLDQVGQHGRHLEHVHLHTHHTAILTSAPPYINDQRGHGTTARLPPPAAATPPPLSGVTALAVGQGVGVYI